jgi:hypothetical protein
MQNATNKAKKLKANNQQQKKNNKKNSPHTHKTKQTNPKNQVCHMKFQCPMSTIT